MRFVLSILVALATTTTVVVATTTSDVPVSGIAVKWDQPIRTLSTEVTCQVVVNPLLDRSSPVHDQIFASLKALGTRHIRYVPWLPYPRLGVAELEPPSGTLLCARADDFFSISLSCPAASGQPNSTISAIQFASYGTGSGYCGDLSTGWCNADNSQSVIETLCLGQSQCTVLAAPSTFGVDPCVDVPKSLIVQAVCSVPANTTYWNFDVIDPMTQDFMDATDSQSDTRIINFSTPPEWLYSATRVPYPTDPDTLQWNYEQGSTLLDQSLNQLGDYYGRLVSYYKNGEFIDEAGRVVQAPNGGQKYNLQYWEVLNEVDSEHSHTVQEYTREYDAIVQGIWRHADPTHSIKFVGMALSGHNEWDWYNYFLNPSNHAPNIPLDFISYHFYATTPLARDDPTGYPSFFNDADTFCNEVPQIEAIRMKLSPTTQTTIDEIGVILPNDNDMNSAPIPPVYWPAAGAMYAYLVARLSLLGINVLGESQLVGYPNIGSLAPQYPSVALLNWTTGVGNARYWVLDLLHKEFEPFEDQMLVTTPMPAPGVNSNTFCAQVLGESNMTLSCSAGSTISAITFASYGTPNGDACGDYSIGSCHASSSQSVIESLCVGQASCMFWAAPSIFGGDPCVGVVKRLYVTATCSNGGQGTVPFSSQLYYAQAYAAADGSDPRLLVISKSLYPITIAVPPGATSMKYIDESTGDGPANQVPFTSNELTLTPFMTAVIYFQS